MAASLEVVQRTDPGRDPNKQVNEDSVGHRATRLGHLLVVCDGMGGHALGQEASQLAVATILQMVESAPPGTVPGAALSRAIVQAGRLVYEMGGNAGQAGRPGSTCVAVLVHARAAEIAHVGDSRAYLVRKGQIWQVTKDHSVVQQMVERGALSPSEAAYHPEANKITRALGMKPDTDVELCEPPIVYAPDDVFVLASDGLCDLVRADEIASVVTQAVTLEKAADELVNMANARGGHDNITVQIARVVGSTAVALTMTENAPAPTLVEHPAAPERTLIDPRAADVTAKIPFPIAPRAPNVSAAVASLGPITRSRTPSQRGWLVLVLSAVLVLLIVLGVVVWWFWKGRA